MRLTGGAGDLLRGLTDMPFLDRLELVAISGWSRDTVYRGLRRLEDAGLVAPVPHGTDLIAPTRRFYVTAAGLRALAREEDLPVENLLRALPVSLQWRRLLLQRLDAVAAIYRLASTVAGVAHPLGLRWYRALPMDATLTLPGGCTVAVVRQGPSSDRTPFSKRLWRLREGPRPSGVLLLVSDEVRLRHARRLLSGFPAPVHLALEEDAVRAGPDDAVWRLPAAGPALGLRAVLERITAEGALPLERPPARATLPTSLDTAAPGRDLPDHLLPALLKPTEKRVVDLLADWPWIAPRDLQGLLGVSRARLSQLIATLEDFGMAARASAAEGRLVLTDRGLAVVARRDRASVGAARGRWSAAPLDAGEDGDWRSVSGRRARQLLRHLDHTASVHSFVAALARQARAGDWEVVQLDPPHSASRYFRYGGLPARAGGTHPVHPDAFGLLRRGDHAWPFFLEWERRAVRPVTMAARLAPYLRYYSTPRPTDDHGVRPEVLVVFQDELAATHFLRVAETEMERARVEVPLWVSHERFLRRQGPLGRAWLRPDGGEPALILPAA